MSLSLERPKTLYIRLISELLPQTNSSDGGNNKGKRVGSVSNSSYSAVVIEDRSDVDEADVMEGRVGERERHQLRRRRRRQRQAGQIRVHFQLLHGHREDRSDADEAGVMERRERESER